MAEQKAQISPETPLPSCPERTVGLSLPAPISAAGKSDSRLFVLGVQRVANRRTTSTSSALTWLGEAAWG